jgi:hypothetical protein
MDNTTLIAIIVIVAIAILAVAAFAYMRKQKSDKLRSRFGPEYDRAVKEHGTARAEAELEQRERRVEALKIRPLKPEDTTRFTTSWNAIQTRFVDDPKGAVTEADRLLGEVMATRGYPMGDFEQRASDISVHYPRVVENYRAGHDIALRHARGEASTEDLRQAMIHYRSLFGELVGERDLSKSRGREVQVEEEKERKGMLR